MTQLFGLFLVIIMAVATFTYLPEDVVCQLDDSCDANVTNTIETVDTNQQDKVVLNVLTDAFIIIGETVTNTTKMLVSADSK